MVKTDFNLWHEDASWLTYRVVRVVTMATDFPTKGEDKKGLRNSNYPQFDYGFIAGVKENDPRIYKAGGNIRGNEAFNLWTKEEMVLEQMVL